MKCLDRQATRLRRQALSRCHVLRLSPWFPRRPELHQGPPKSSRSTRDPLPGLTLPPEPSCDRFTWFKGGRFAFLFRKGPDGNSCSLVSKTSFPSFWFLNSVIQKDYSCPYSYSHSSYSWSYSYSYLYSISFLTVYSCYSLFFISNMIDSIISVINNIITISVIINIIMINTIINIVIIMLVSL